MTNSTDSNDTPGLLLGVYLAEACVIVIVNSLALAVFLKKKFRAKKSTYLLVNLTVADLMVGFTTIFRTMKKLTGVDFKLFDIICLLINYISVSASLFSFTAIAMERAYAILKPLKHRLLRKKTYFIGIVIIWKAAVFIDIAKILQLAKDIHGIEYRILLAIKISFGLFLLVIVFSCYLAIWIKVKLAKPLPNQRPANNNNNRLTSTLFTVTFVSLICFIPIGITRLGEVFNRDGIFKSLFPLAAAMIYGNSFINFIIYSSRMPEFRKELRTIIKKCCYEQQVQENVPSSFLQNSEGRGQSP
ncbi:predicted protein [Nematostella vectensis]|uniref:G-protein coupled receptors family 1 profile domain-containing protein n=1 Tax=Nematostella vectensis TaxID=45351 RepID=A7RV11_NEMVE|nr:predicted protein [Nematostella vectensis]|eukprot:XP_001636728.1 predicted protein [Nematostella vectensis]